MSREIIYGSSEVTEWRNNQYRINVQNGVLERKLESNFKKAIKNSKVRGVPGRIPNAVKEFLSVNPDFPVELLVCAEHGLYFDYIDSLAPYHWEHSECKLCRESKGDD